MDMYLPEILFGGFMLLLLLGAPITVALGGAAMGAYMVLDKDPIALVQIAFNSVGSFPLMALPAFVLAGALMEAAGISRRLVDIAETLAGPITGGLGVATVLACLFFGAISGSGPATTAAVGIQNRFGDQLDGLCHWGIRGRGRVRCALRHDGFR